MQSYRRVSKTRKGKAGGVIGIDLGSTFSCVAAIAPNGEVQIIANDNGSRTTPSYAAFCPTTHDRLIGEAALNQDALNHGGIIFDIKRLMGNKFDDHHVRRDSKYLPYAVVNKNGKPYVEIEVNQRVMDYFIKLIHGKYGKDIRGDSRALGKLGKECEKAKL